MLPIWGNYCLVMALCLAVVQAVVPLWGSLRNRPVWIETANMTAIGQLLFIGASFAILAYSLMTDDFSVAYVAQNSNSHLPLLYKFCATWGAHEGSLLLWVLILSVWMVMVVFGSKSIPKEIKAQVLSVLAMVSVGFLLFLLLTSNPFARLFDVPLQGRDLNPLLQDPGLAIHPPMLYMGYVGFSVAFAFAIAALISGRFDASWSKWARTWALIAWSFLTLGITLGSWWAYRVLGWGGWWFWDPVENASFLPWLAGTALIHSLLVAAKRDTFKIWTILLAMCTFALSLMGTFLVRSGVLVSVHAFAVDPARGAFMLYFLAVVVGGSLLLYAWRAPTIKNNGTFQLWSRETVLLTNNVLLTSAMLTVLLGTVYPLIIDALGLGKLSVGPPYFNAVFVPLMLPVLFLMGIGPSLQWRHAQLSLVVGRFKYTVVIALSLALFLPWLLTGQLQLGVVLGLSLAFWVILATLQQNLLQLPRASYNRFVRWGMLVAHCGFAICVIGIVITSHYSIQKDVRMVVNDSLKVGPYDVSFQGVQAIVGPNYKAYQGYFVATSRGKSIALSPELRLFDSQKMALPKTAIDAKPSGDLYIALADQLEQNAWSIRIYYKPFIRWIWAGGLLMMVGGILAALQRSRIIASKEEA